MNSAPDEPGAESTERVDFLASAYWSTMIELKSGA